VTLALQNHPPVIHDADEMLRMIREDGIARVEGVLRARPLARKQGVASMQQAVGEVGALQVLTHFGGEYDIGADGQSGQLRAASGLAVSSWKISTPTSCAPRSRGVTTATSGIELCHPLPQENGRTVGPRVCGTEREAGRRIHAGHY
jgi:hypothetical protein